MRQSVVLVATLLFGVSAAAKADLQFVEVTRPAGLEWSGPTAGASWGDMNADGLPDLWVGNHSFVEANPRLFLNQGDGTFLDVSDRVQIPRDADLHGAAWADFDGDGDQDLLILAGGGGGSGSSANLLLRNEDGVFRDIAAETGLQIAAARGRTPLWLDANLDGQLDVVLSNMHRPDGVGGSQLLYQDSKHMFSSDAEVLFAPTPRSWADDLLLKVLNIASYRAQDDYGAVQVLDVFAQLGDVDSDGAADLISYGNPTYVYSPSPQGLKFQPSQIIATERQVADVAVADFDGDGQLDSYLARVRDAAPDVTQINENEIRAHLQAASGGSANALEFAASERLKITIVDLWEIEQNLPPVFIGDQRLQPGTMEFEVSSKEARSEKALERPGPEVHVSFHGDRNRWRIDNWAGRFNFRIQSLGAPITNVVEIGFDSHKGDIPDRLVSPGLFGYERWTPPWPTNAFSVAAADFDNDMDVDLYLVCTEPARNAPNMLLVNDGSGVFELLPNAGGAAGSELGRGDVVALADFDVDGFVDVFVTNGRGAAPFSDDGPYQLFRNSGNQNNWLQIDLQGTSSNPEGIGAVVEVVAGEVTQLRLQGGGMHSFAQDHSRLHFGLSKYSTVELVRVVWPSGKRQELRDIQVNQVLKIVEE